MKPLQTAMVLALSIALSTASHAQTNHQSSKTTVTMNVTEQNIETVRKVYEQALNQRQPALLQELVSPAYTAPNGATGAAAFAQQTEPLLQAFPDIQWQIADITAADTRVMVHWQLRGTHKAAFNGYAPTGKTVTNDGMAVYTLADGKITAAHVLTDRLGFLQQLDVLPGNAALQQQGKDNVYFIDRFLVPAAGISEFRERTNINRAFIRQLPGFITDAAYEYTDEQGSLICVTVARWASKEAMAKAKEAVQAEYRRQGFDPAAMMQRLHIQMERNVYTAFGQ